MLKGYEVNRSKLPPDLREYQYRSLFGGTHEQFLDEPALTIDGLLAIHEVFLDNQG